MPSVATFRNTGPRQGRARGSLACSGGRLPRQPLRRDRRDRRRRRAVPAGEAPFRDRVLRRQQLHRPQGRRPDHQRAFRGGRPGRAVPRAPGPSYLRAQRRASGRAGGNVGLRRARREADGVRGRGRNDDRRCRRQAGQGVRGPRLRSLGAVPRTVRGRRLRRGPPIRPARRSRRSPKRSEPSFTSRAARRGPAARTTRRSISGTRSSRQGGCGALPGGIPTSIRSATGPRSPSCSRGKDRGAEHSRSRRREAHPLSLPQ